MSEACDHPLFVYGTLQVPELLDRLLGRVPPSRAALLEGHRAAPLRGLPHPGLVVDPASVATGRVLRVSGAEREVLDRFEGDEYSRVPVRPRLDGGSTVAAEAWLLTGPSSAEVEAGCWDLERFVAEAAPAFVGGSLAGRAHPGAGT